MAYKWTLLSSADDDLTRLDTPTAKRILKKLRWIAAQPDPLRYARQLSDPAIGDLRFRIGDYRIIAVVQEKQKKILLVAIGHRRDIYR
jgi:mRNA interferase RelE/StbE